MNDPCPLCNGRGGTLERDVDGDGVWAMPVERYVPCQCVEEGRCPGCLSPGVPDDADISEFTCETCGWYIDWDSVARIYQPDY